MCEQHVAPFNMPVLGGPDITPDLMWSLATQINMSLCVDAQCDINTEAGKTLIGRHQDRSADTLH